MTYLDLTLPTPAENLALDEALLEQAEAAARSSECLRLWEPSEPMVIVGRSSQVAREVRMPACRERGIPVLRRGSGGAAVVTGPGCLMYAVVLDLRSRPELRAIDAAHRFVLETLVAGIGALAPGIAVRGTSDLALGDRKFSGNSLRVKRDHLLYHGTLLYDFPLPLIELCLAPPSRQPCYRGGRSHGAFVTNLPVSGAELRRALLDAWSAMEPLSDWPADRTRTLALAKYARREWNERL
ncbi:MAG TPA: lipoate--protein ligase family protein [Pirellulales bacterium]|nr:lipoate--protein ligase family protein [Pirellulales bacterium]